MNLHAIFIYLFILEGGGGAYFWIRTIFQLIIPKFRVSRSNFHVVQPLTICTVDSKTVDTIPKFRVGNTPRGRPFSRPLRHHALPAKKNDFINAIYLLLGAVYRISRSQLFNSEVGHMLNRHRFYLKLKFGPRSHTLATKLHILRAMYRISTLGSHKSILTPSNNENLEKLTTDVPLGWLLGFVACGRGRERKKTDTTPRHALHK